MKLAHTLAGLLGLVPSTPFECRTHVDYVAGAAAERWRCQGIAEAGRGRPVPCFQKVLATCRDLATGKVTVTDTATFLGVCRESPEACVGAALGEARQVFGPSPLR